MFAAVSASLIPVIFLVNVAQKGGWVRRKEGRVIFGGREQLEKKNGRGSWFLVVRRGGGDGVGEMEKGEVCPPYRGSCSYLPSSCSFQLFFSKYFSFSRKEFPRERNMAPLIIKCHSGGIFWRVPHVGQTGAKRPGVTEDRVGGGKTSGLGNSGQAWGLSPKTSSFSWKVLINHF